MMSGQRPGTSCGPGPFVRSGVRRVLRGCSNASGARPLTSSAREPTMTSSYPFYITTAIEYANGEPHLGHAVEKIGADAIARFHRLRGDDVRLLVGTEENEQK